MVTEVPTEPPRARPNWTLLRKTVRDLRRRPAQSVAIAVIVMLGVLLFIASYDSFRNLTASYNRTYDRLHFADLTASGATPPSWPPPRGSSPASRTSRPAWCGTDR